MAIQNTLINGNRYSYTSVEVQLGDNKYVGSPFKSINYSTKQEPGMVYGADRRPIGRTAGIYQASGNFEMLRSEWQAFSDGLMDDAEETQGLHDMEFNIVISYAELDSDIIIDELISCRMSNIDLSNSQGSTDASVVKCDLSLMEIKLDTLLTVGPNKQGNQ